MALVLFATVVSFMPHRITEWPYVVLTLAFAVLFAKQSVQGHERVTSRRMPLEEGV